MDQEDDQKLWELLGKGRTPQVSPFFARNVLRATRAEPKVFAGLRSWFVRPKLAVFSGVAAAVIAMAVALHFSSNGKQTLPRENVDLVKANVDEDFATDIDDLIAAGDDDDDDVAVL